MLSPLLVSGALKLLRSHPDEGPNEAPHPGAPAADPGLLLASAMGAQSESEPVPTPLTGYIVTLVSSWSQIYPGLAAIPALTPAALEKIDRVRRECIPAIAAAYADQPLADYVDTEALMTAPWAALLERNAAGRQAIRTPVLVVQGTADPLVPAATTEALIGRLCQIGTVAELKLYPEVGHGAVIAAAMPDILAWTSDRRAGKPAASTC